MKGAGDSRAEVVRCSYGPTPFWPWHEQGCLKRDCEKLPMMDSVIWGFNVYDREFFCGKYLIHLHISPITQQLSLLIY